MILYIWWSFHYPIGLTIVMIGVKYWKQYLKYGWHLVWHIRPMSRRYLSPPYPHPIAIDSQNESHNNANPEAPNRSKIFKKTFEVRTVQIWSNFGLAYLESMKTTLHTESRTNRTQRLGVSKSATMKKTWKIEKTFFSNGLDQWSFSISRSGSYCCSSWSMTHWTFYWSYLHAGKNSNHNPFKTM